MTDRLAASPELEEKRIVRLDERLYDLEILRRTKAPLDAPRLVVVAHVLNPIAQELLRCCIMAVEFFTPEPHELWIVDNNSPREYVDWLREMPRLNLVFNRTEPLPPDARTLAETEPGQVNQRTWGSYANAIGLELAVGLIDPGSHYLMSLHMDALPCRVGWLSFLSSKIIEGAGAAGVRMDTARTPDGVLHVLGYMVDFRLFQRLGLDFFPELPQLDVGDRVTIKLREAGYRVFACPNTVWEPELAARIPGESPLRDLHVDRAFDDDGNVIFLHLGRGLRRSSGEHRKGTTAEQWIRLVEDHLLGQPPSRPNQANSHEPQTAS